mgnify:CR=1 FL=1
MVGTDGYAPSTFSMSMKHSTIELSPLVQDPRLSHSDANFKIIIFQKTRYLNLHLKKIALGSMEQTYIVNY